VLPRAYILIRIAANKGGKVQSYIDGLYTKP